MTNELESLRAEYERLVARGLALDLTRGKPSPEQLDLSARMLSSPGDDFRAADGTDCRNYGGPQGLPELRELWGELLGIPAAQLIAAGNASLALMHDCVVNALLRGTTDGPRWVDEPVAFLCPVPGYDRHFALCEGLGIELIPVPMTDTGPDLDVVRRLVAADRRIKGMWCVPMYSNPTGVTYTDQTVRALAAMPTAAPDFRLFWDNAYAVHHLTDDEPAAADILGLCARAGHPDRPLVFASTSKITTAGSGVGFFGSSPRNVAWLLEFRGTRTIGPDKLNQLRHIRLLPDQDSVRAHMRAHRRIIAPKFDVVDDILRRTLTGIATWTRPAGGYFISLDVPDGCATRAVDLARRAGIALTPAGAPYPHGHDPRDRTIRIAPTLPTLDEVADATTGLALCVRLAAAEKS